MHAGCKAHESCPLHDLIYGMLCRPLRVCSSVPSAPCPEHLSRRVHTQYDHVAHPRKSRWLRPGQRCRGPTCPLARTRDMESKDQAPFDVLRSQAPAPVGARTSHLAVAPLQQQV